MVEVCPSFVRLSSDKQTLGAILTTTAGRMVSLHAKWGDRPAIVVIGFPLDINFFEVQTYEREPEAVNPAVETSKTSNAN